MYKSEFFSGSHLFIRPWYRIAPMYGTAMASGLLVISLNVYLLRHANPLSSTAANLVVWTSIITIYLWFVLIRIHGEIRQELERRNALTEPSGLPKHDMIAGSSGRLLFQFALAWNLALVLLLSALQSH